QEIITPEIYTSDPTGIGKGIFYMIFYGISLVLSIISLLLGIGTWKESRNVVRFIFLLPLLFWMSIISWSYINGKFFTNSVDYYLTTNTFTSPDYGSVRGHVKLGEYWLYSSTGDSGAYMLSYGFISSKLPSGEINAYWQENNFKSKTTKYYYIYMSNFELVKNRFNNYSIHLSLGALALSEKAISPDVKKLAYKYSIDLSPEIYKYGRNDTLYYIVLIKSFKDNKIVYSINNNYYQKIEDVPFEEYTGIQSIEVTKKQYSYLIENEYLDENAPDLTEEQLAYIRQNHPASSNKKK
ncbi:MAG: hypothetical protein JW982_06820, partial [Spirochaetes bacterium]|nr:hypothetical protein [Spirochaetota bacterium]